MENQFSELMSKHSEEKLREIVANRKKYDLRAYKTVEGLDQRRLVEVNTLIEAKIK